jgi:hypothetical protein
VVLVLICVLVIREIWHPELDIVRSDGSDDPAGGMLDGAPDWPHRSQHSEPVVYADGMSLLRG